MKPLWTPSNSFKQQSNLANFEAYLQHTLNLQFDDYEALWKWSTTRLDQFWESIWRYFDILDHGAYTTVVDYLQMPGTAWFPGSKINYAEHIFRAQTNDRLALLACNEKEVLRPVGWEELKQGTAAFRSYLQASGVQKGDRVAAYLPNIPETVMAFLAVNSLGAIWSCCSMDFGAHTVIERLSQIEPKVFLIADGYFYKGRDFDKQQDGQHIISNISSIEQVVLVPYLGNVLNLSCDILWSEVLSDYASPELDFEPVSFDHPMWVLYSSGTTGKPKAITHSHGGMLLEHLKYLSFHNDVKTGENFFWFTTTGWMMWNFLQASLLVGATPVLYEGSPGFPDLNVLWRLAERLPVHQ